MTGKNRETSGTGCVDCGKGVWPQTAIPVAAGALHAAGYVCEGCALRREENGYSFTRQRWV